MIQQRDNLREKAYLLKYLEAFGIKTTDNFMDVDLSITSCKYRPPLKSESYTR